MYVPPIDAKSDVSVSDSCNCNCCLPFLKKKDKKCNVDIHVDVKVDQVAKKKIHHHKK